MIAASGKKEIYTFTPKGDTVYLPMQSTVLDFAFQVHTEVGKRCAAAQIGSSRVEPDHILKDGDKVKIILQDKPVLFERHAVGGEYQAGYKTVGAGKVETIFTGVDGSKVTVDSRDLADAENAVVTYHNPLDNVPDLARIFYDRCLLMGVTPYVVTKKTVFKWQEGFWRAMKEVCRCPTTPPSAFLSACGWPTHADMRHREGDES